MTRSPSQEDRAFRRGDVVRVKSREDILATLDENGTLGSLPFMPEMLQFAGKELPVHARADKTCDTVYLTGTTLQMERTVFLVSARCDGSAHGGCQASCLLFWREDWLEWSDRPASEEARPNASSLSRTTVDTLHAATQEIAEDGEIAYRCQATQLPRAASPLRGMSRHFYNDVRNRNVDLKLFARGMWIGVFNKFQRTSAKLPGWLRFRGGRQYPFLRARGDGARLPVRGLLPGDLVEIRPLAEIEATLGPDNCNGRLLFDPEMAEFCGRRARVLRHITQVLNEKTGKMIKLGDCIVLEDVVCQGVYHRFCRRAITPYWREAWLTRVELADQDVAVTRI